MDRNDGFDRLAQTIRHLRDDRCETVRRKVVRIRIDVDKNRDGPDAGNGPCRSEKSIRCGDHAVSRADAGGHQGQDQRIRTRRNAHGMPAVTIVGDLLFQGFHMGAQNEVLAVVDLFGNFKNTILYALVLGFEVKQGYIHKRFPENFRIFYATMGIPHIPHQALAGRRPFLERPFRLPLFLMAEAASLHRDCTAS
jgi:hypothetical protein